MKITKHDFVRYTTQILLFINTFTAEAIFRQRDLADKSIDLQIVFKMGVWAATFVFCVMLIRLWFKQLLRIDKFFELLLLIMILVSCTYAPNPTYSLASAFSLFAIFFLLFLSSATLHNREIIWPIVAGCSLVSLISLIVYVVAPDFGRMHEWVNGVNVIGPRLTGITGTANAIGYISAFACLGLYYYRYYLPARIPLWFIAMLGVNFTALLLSNSRTSLLALILSILTAGVVRLNPARMAIFFIFICSVIMFFAVIDLDWLFSMLARSGDSSEITSGTGRTEIWKTTLRLIAEKPFLGWGYASSIFVLPAQDIIPGYNVPHTHNAFLQVLFSGGIVGLVLFISVLLTKFIFAFRFRDPLNVSFLTFLLIDGMAEPIAFYGPATTTTLVLAAVLSFKYKETNETSHNPHQ